MICGVIVVLKEKSMLTLIAIEFGIVLIALLFINIRLDGISYLINILLKKERDK